MMNPMVNFPKNQPKRKNQDYGGGDCFLFKRTVLVKVFI